MVMYLELSIPKRSDSASVSSGVATENVVAVPAISATTASTSMILPGALSVYLPRMGRQASEYFCFFLPRTCSMKPKAAASTA